MKTVGYFEGTNSVLLTELVARGFGTLPLANDWDGHGKIASHLAPNDVDLIIGYLHKIVAPKHGTPKKEKPHLPPDISGYRGLSPFDLLYQAKSYSIPVLVIVPAEHHDAAKELLGKAIDFVTLVRPEELEEKVREL
ncbi:MAG: hypothetical protein ACTSU3_07360, partial [Candidatus Thorarchaeota archaeon]